MYQSLNSKQRDLFFTCLLLANHEPKSLNWKGNIYTCNEGEFITSLPALKKMCAKDTSIQSIRTGLLILSRWQFLTSESTATGRLIKIVKWPDYQSIEDNQQTNQQIVNRLLTDDKLDFFPSPSSSSSFSPPIYITPPLSSSPTSSSLRKYIVDFKNFISLFNSLTHKNFRPTKGLEQKYIVRRKSYSADDLLKAVKSLTSSPFHTGTNDRNTYYATPEFLLRNDEQVDKWLNTEPLYKGKPKIELSEEALKILNQP